MSGRCHGGRRGRPRRHEVPISDEIPAQEGVGQANVAEPVDQQAMGALAREMARALRESMDILKTENQVQAQVTETGSSFLKREFFRSNPDELLGDPNEPLKADEWLEQMVKKFEMLSIEDGGLTVTLASFQLKGGAGQWWKYAWGRSGGTWEAFVDAF
ncbi:hypothetical protein HYC85_029016 [Camellia sinensis]|uniref:Retrotransposon gag domain-containing protein n=1 Tax=Camellia sinensis TaxID=4442 RepID=A0A7J7FWX4_CAMSI|nr:hypothetical protein HYC85_029016 [Camellia sinensis]